MKTIIASAIVALSFAVPAVADVQVEEFFALGNDSAAERLVSETSQGDVTLSQGIGAWANESAAERQVNTQAHIATRNSTLISFFAMGNDSAAEM